VGGQGAETLDTMGITGEREAVSAAVFSSTIIESGSVGSPSSPISPILDQEEAQVGRMRHRRTRSLGNIFTNLFRL
jgi:hypothetical protein